MSILPPRSEKSSKGPYNLVVRMDRTEMRRIRLKAIKHGAPVSVIVRELLKRFLKDPSW